LNSGIFEPRLLRGVSGGETILPSAGGVKRIRIRLPNGHERTQNPEANEERR